MTKRWFESRFARWVGRGNKKMRWSRTKTILEKYGVQWRKGNQRQRFGTGATLSHLEITTIRGVTEEAIAEWVHVAEPARFTEYPY